MKLRCTFSLLGPRRVQNDLYEIAPTEARYEVLQDVRLYVAEGRLRLGSDAVCERLEDAALEVRTGMQRSDLGPLAVTDRVIADSQDVVFHSGCDQCDLGFHELRDSRCGVQSNRGPHAPDAVLGDAVALQELARLVSAVHLEPSPIGAERLAKADIVEHRTDVEQLRIEAQAAVAALQAAEPVHPAGVMVDQLAGGVAYELGGLCSELRVRYADARSKRWVGVGLAVHTVWSRKGHTSSFQASHPPRRRYLGSLTLSLSSDPREFGSPRASVE